MSNRITNFIAVCLLLFVFIITVLSIVDDSLTMDELAHLPAGYSYLTQKDMRINPEHPPLIKDLSAIPLLFIKDIKFPSEIKSWKEDINGQWIFGNYLLFKTDNPAEEMIFWGRIPMIFILLIAGFFIFRWARELFGNGAGLLALFMFSFSPTFLAHGRLVTTDVGAATGVLIATYYFIKFLKKSSKSNLVKAGIALGLAELFKFSLILLIPFFGIIIVYWAIIKSADFKDFIKIFIRYFVYCFIIGLIALALIWLVYLYHIWNYPVEKQVADTKFTLASFGSRGVVNAVVFMAGNPVLRPLGQYLLGLCMILQRASGGNTGYFLGEMSASGWKTYFPVVYFIKETLTFHILTLIALLYLLKTALKNGGSFLSNFKKRLFDWLKKSFVYLSLFIFIAIYWITSLNSNLNIGARHLLPAFPFTIILVAGIIIMCLKKTKDANANSGLSKIKISVLFILLAFQAYSVLSVYPSFLTYFNESIGGPSQGYKYVVDSNLDWGQELKRLNIWLDENKIDKVYLDYFGGSDTDYYLKGKYARWCGECFKPEDLPKSSYIAISVTLLQGGRGKPVPGFTQSSGYYHWLDKYQPVKIIGNSIFVYKID